MASGDPLAHRVESDGVRLHIWLALAAIAVGLYVGGGLRRPQALEFACATGIALVWAFVAVPPRRADLNSITGSLAVLALLAVGRAETVGRWTDGLGYALVCATAASLLLVAERSSRRERQILLGGTIGLVALLAVTGIAGVALHHEPLALPGTGAWRASTTLTYPNAAAALFGPAALLALDLAGRSTRPRWLLVTAALLLTGSLATLSRAAPLALVAGLALLCFRSGFGTVARSAVPSFTGMVVLGASLGPSLAHASTPRPVLAIAGGAAAAGAVLVTSTFTRRVSTRTLALGALGLLAAAAVLFVVAIGTRGGLASSSTDRTEEARAAGALLRDHPFTGVGPGAAALTWQDPTGQRFQAKYAHNDYLQVATELGVLGALALAVAMWSTAVVAWRSDPRRIAPATADVAPALLCLALHVGQDFILHFPAIVGVAALWIGVAASQGASRQAPTSTG